MTSASSLTNSVGSRGLNSDRILPKLKKDGILMIKKSILTYLFQQGGVGASTQKIASNLRINYRHAAKLLHQLEMVGECFTKGKNWCSTAATLAFDPGPTVERLKAELERDLFGQELTPRARAFLTEFSAAAKLNLSVDEGFHFAQRKVLEEAGPHAR